MKKFMFFFTLLLPVIAFSQPALVPMPAEMKMGAGNFILTSKTRVISAQKNGYQESITNLNTLLRQKMGFELKHAEVLNTAGDIDSNGIIYINLTNDSSEAYELTVSRYRVNFSGSAKGLFYALQTFEQLLNPLNKTELSIPQLFIKDYPRFAYRGMHLDVARHVFPVAFIKKYIDYLAAYKFNTFHWHLTDDQGWRIEIKKYPKLTQVGAYRNGTIIGRYPGTGNDSIRYGGYYTQEQIKEVVRYASQRHITVIPEIEMPGHASAAIAAYPQLSCFPAQDTKVLETTPWAGSRKGKQVQQTWGVFEDVFCPSEYTFNFLENVLDEVMALFPSSYVHIGGDESPKEAWKKSAFCQQLIKTKKLKDEHGLQSYFIQRMEKYVNSRGKKIIGWDEILEGGLAPNATVMSWRGEQGGIVAAKQKHDVIMTPGESVYFDHTQSANEDSVTIGGYTPLEKVYEYEPVPAAIPAENAKYVLGAQANLWTEYIKNPSKVEYMLFPRIAALSEVLWTGKNKRNWKSFEERLPHIFETLEAKKINYSKAFYELKAYVLPTPNYNGVLWKLESKKDEAISINLNGGDSVWDYTEPQLIAKETHTASASSKMVTLTQRFFFNKATGKKIILVDEPSNGYPGDGAFTLVNGVHNEKGLSRSREFIGFAGKNLEAVIDLGETTDVNEVVLHCLEQTGSWIYRPVSVSFLASTNGKDYMLIETITTVTGKRFLLYNTRKKMQARYIKLLAKNQAVIASGLPGAGNAAWLFADEIEVK